jgi:hypothetical protein
MGVHCHIELPLALSLQSIPNNHVLAQNSRRPNEQRYLIRKTSGAGASPGHVVRGLGRGGWRESM